MNSWFFKFPLMHTRNGEAFTAFASRGNTMRYSLTKLLLSVVLVGCASEEGLQQYAKGAPIDPRIVELGLPEITDKQVKVIPIGQLINDNSAVFLASDGAYYLVSLARPLSGSQGDEVFLLEGREIVLGDSILTLSNGPKTKSQAYSNRMYRSPSLNGAYQSSGGGPYQRRESRALAIFQLKGKKHVQEIADLFNR
jgi:hypothetical protein